jgi:hypothetical protein
MHIDLGELYGLWNALLPVRRESPRHWQATLFSSSLFSKGGFPLFAGTSGLTSPMAAAPAHLLMTGLILDSKKELTQLPISC